MQSEIRTATTDDVADVATVLTDAFADDPLMRWVFADDVRRARLDAQWRFIAGVACVPRRASTVVPGGIAAALWLGPGDRLGDAFWEEHGPEYAAAMDGDVARTSALGEVMARHHPHDPHHWYLLAIGVSPARQGERLGSALLAFTLAEADARGTPAYLEATSPRSRVMYERFGFEVTDELTVEDSPPFWAMWREPR